MPVHGGFGKSSAVTDHYASIGGERAEPLTEKDGTALADGLLSAMAKTSASP
ncbi:hypothetical protein AB0L26_33680 [Streptomyces nondiastaticus]|uniref:hypothetical protein n=1 Tax=Streptomyces nondiastaticus TaxID=3154512 RepID=UPI00344063ED